LTGLLIPSDKKSGLFFICKNIIYFKFSSGISIAVASIIYGEPRLTNDIDLVIALKPDDVENFTEAFPIEEFYCPPPEIIKVEISRSLRGHFNLIHHETGLRADIYLCGDDELHRWALQNRNVVDVENE
jgi:hypothetical protein